MTQGEQHDLDVKKFSYLLHVFLNEINGVELLTEFASNAGVFHATEVAQFY
jgi:hypothetical protein